MTKTLSQHLDPAHGPKRILALDGGGIRGALTLGYLKRIEGILQSAHGTDYRLCDHFDLIGGTSTGSIIASGLALGMPVDEIWSRYKELGKKIFGDRNNWWNPFETARFLKAGYNHKMLESSLKDTYGDTTLGSDKILTGLCIVAKRADTNSTWPLINHPGGRFYDSADGRNKDIPLWQAVRASSAAPTYFVPQMIDVGEGVRAAFVDGGVSMANNPALTLLQVATLRGFPFRWEMGADKLTLVSVGTGYTVFRKAPGDISDAWLATWAANVPDMLMQDASWQNQIMLQWLSESPTAQSIDMEMGDLKGDLLAGKPLLHYLRYNQRLTEADLNSLGLSQYFKEQDIKDLAEMSNARNCELLYEIGSMASLKEVKPEHFG